MKNLLLILTGVAALVTAGTAVNPHNTAYNAREAITEQGHDHNDVNSAEETITLRRRECEISCPISLGYCYYAPYNYKCDRNGKLQWTQRDINCEHPTWGCWCGCDWRVPGIEKKGVSSAEVEF
ncbi:uncharacterized protein ColSpa_08308 [Colletotrichum spaethianum]|uniref:Uncharacterized protein n=1 Tax=Colletotrichum spaethianum TaxID=700344 RepID=A0AA37P9I5_9PEZI|nr:uncharacterized protein ColSpa_08308 [Colletotrichum spaethianum]GKT48127.1 hypothetical protein ColSpa_08308 [Colletotrichum spaethianum]